MPINRIKTRTSYSYEVRATYIYNGRVDNLFHSLILFDINGRRISCIFVDLQDMEMDITINDETTTTCI